MKAPLPWVCPTCKAHLDVPTGRCAVCRTSALIIGETLPIFLTEPRSAVGLAYMGLASRAASKRAMAERLGTPSPLRAALATEAAALSSLAAHIGLHAEARSALESISPALKPKVEGSFEQYLDPLSYAARDWGGAAAAEQEIERVMGCVERFSTHAPDRTSALVLGAGAGRFADEALSLYDRVAALDNSVAMGLVYDALRKGDLAFDAVDARNCQTADEQVTQVALSRARIKRTPRLAKATAAFAVGDALCLPLPNSSQAAVLSLFFTDVLPLPSLLREVSRVLKPGGVFVHYGPLEYHFADLAQQYPASGVRTLFADVGFTMLDEAWVPGFHRERQNALSKRWFNCWAFVARLDRPRALRLPEGANQPLVLAPSYRIDTSTVHPASGAESQTSTVILPDGAQRRVESGVIELIQNLDGATTFAMLLTSLASQGPLAQDERLSLQEAINGLIDFGLVRLGSADPFS